MNPITLIIADDDPFVLQSLKTILQAKGTVRVLADTTRGDEALILYEKHRPDIALLDIRMPDLTGLAAAERILAAHAHARIVFLTTFADDDYLVRALALGARGYLIKQEAATLERSLRAVMDGQLVLGSDVSERVGALIGRTEASRAADDPSPDGCGTSDGFGPTGEPAFADALTERERDIARLVAEGLDNREIASALFLSEGTVRNHLSAILQKTGLRNRTQLAIAWWRDANERQ